MIALCAIYVDDTLHAGSEEYSELSKQRKTAFTYEMGAWDNLQFTGLHVKTYGEKFRGR